MELQLIQNKIFEVRGSKIMLDFDFSGTIWHTDKIIKSFSKAKHRKLSRRLYVSAYIQ